MCLLAGHTTCDPPACPTRVTDDHQLRTQNPPKSSHSSVTIIKPVQSIVAIREFEAGPSLDLNAHVDAV